MRKRATIVDNEPNSFDLLRQASSSGTTSPTIRSPGRSPAASVQRVEDTRSQRNVLVGSRGTIESDIELSIYTPDEFDGLTEDPETFGVADEDSLDEEFLISHDQQSIGAMVSTWDLNQRSAQLPPLPSLPEPSSTLQKSQSSSLSGSGGPPRSRLSSLQSVQRASQSALNKSSSQGAGGQSNLQAPSTSSSRLSFSSPGNPTSSGVTRTQTWGVTPSSSVVASNLLAQSSLTQNMALQSAPSIKSSAPQPILTPGPTSAESALSSSPPPPSDSPTQSSAPIHSFWNHDEQKTKASESDDHSEESKMKGLDDSSELSPNPASNTSMGMDFSELDAFENVAEEFKALEEFGDFTLSQPSSSPRSSTKNLMLNTYELELAEELRGLEESVEQLNLSEEDFMSYAKSNIFLVVMVPLDQKFL